MRGHITAISVIAVAVTSIAALEVHVILEVDVPGRGLVLGHTVLHDPPIVWHLGADPASVISQHIPELIPPLVHSDAIIQCHHTRYVYFTIHYINYLELLYTDKPLTTDRATTRGAIASIFHQMIHSLDCLLWIVSFVAVNELERNNLESYHCTEVLPPEHAKI